MRTLILVSLLSMVAFSGCIDGNADTDSIDLGATVGYVAEATGILPTDIEFFGAVKTSLATHPAYGYPSYMDFSGLDVDVPLAWVPPVANQLPEVVTSMELLAETSAEVASGAGIAVFGHYAFLSGNGPGSIVDIADPANPVKVADLEDGIRDADLIAHPDGRLTLVAASNGPIFLYDVTDPTNPVTLTALLIDENETANSHNAAVVPGTPIVYNANSAGGSFTGFSDPTAATHETASGVTEIFDLTDPSNPVRLDDFENGYGCHDITFFIDAANEKYRAYCAGIEMTQIWDIEDPTNPEVIANIPVHYGVEGAPSASVFLAMFSHLAMVSADGNILIVGDESGGGLANACDVNVDAQVQTLAGPTGNLWFYDISDETNPMLLSAMNPTNPASQTDYQMKAAEQVQMAVTTFAGSEPGTTSVLNLAFSSVPSGCTAHFGRIIEDKDQMLMSFYGAGSLLIDFSDPAHPTILDQFSIGGNTWDVWEYQGYAFTGDLNRGMDVLLLS